MSKNKESAEIISDPILAEKKEIVMEKPELILIDLTEEPKLVLLEDYQHLNQKCDVVMNKIKKRKKETNKRRKN